MALERSDEGAKRHGRTELAPLTRPSLSALSRATDWHPSGGLAAHVNPAAEAGRSDAGQGGSAHDRSARDPTLTADDPP